MTPEGKLFLRFIEEARDMLLSELRAVTPDNLNRPLQIPETNTLFASAYHAAGSTEWWVVEGVGGTGIARDREAEFTASGGMAALEARWQRVLARCRQTLDPYSEAEYGAPREVEIDGAPQQWTVRQCLIHTVAHANIHVGHVQLARQVVEKTER